MTLRRRLLMVLIELLGQLGHNYESTVSLPFRSFTISSAESCVFANKLYGHWCSLPYLCNGAAMWLWPWHGHDHAHGNLNRK